ncbi:hypothetical protein ACSLC0_11200 [Stenotrophomonas muris]|jgi:hypothetical protein|uniref:hypothetical protein n=1 Tax=Stenotrophomonas muris TaxID=2963283 RepID=UPI0021CAE05E|nr:hypothetical protein [Stenotrophomonas muris]MCU1119746.1 hypothetical protein [Stenotrophomonas maltophilia]MCU1133070.1 hypothetical protein [Stenotrophomonas maltophilia]
MVLLPLLAGGCGAQAPQTYGDGFPVAKPMDLVHAGATVEARFELPPPWEKDPRPRTFLIGFRTGGPAKRPDMKPGDVAFLEDARIPLKVQLWKLEGDTDTPMALQVLNRDLPAVWQGNRYQPAKGDVYEYRSAVGADSDSLVNAGKYDMSLAYREYEVARADSGDLTAGKYRLKVTNLQGNPDVAHLNFELLVANYNVK